MTPVRGTMTVDAVDEGGAAPRSAAAPAPHSTPSRRAPSRPGIPLPSVIASMSTGPIPVVSGDRAPLPGVAPEAQSGLLLVVSRDRFPTSSDEWYSGQAHMLIEDQTPVREALSEGRLADADLDILVTLEETLPLAEATDKQADNLVGLLEYALALADGRPLAVRVSEPRWASVLREYEWLFPTLHVLPGHDPLVARLTAACMRMHVRERRRVIDELNVRRDWAVFSGHAGRGHVWTVLQQEGPTAPAPTAGGRDPDRAGTPPESEDPPPRDGRPAPHPVAHDRGALEIGHLHLGLRSRGDAASPTHPGPPAARTPGHPVQVASDGAHNPRRGTTWGYFTSQGNFRMGVCDGSVSAAELHALHMAVNDHPSVPLVVWTDSRRALSLLNAELLHGVDPRDRQVARRVRSLAELVTQRREGGQDIAFHWVRAHTSHLSSTAAVLNDAADRLAKLALRRWCTPGLSEGVEDIALSIARETADNLSLLGSRVS